MKKIIAIIMAVCLLASVMCVTAYAVPDPFQPCVISVRALKTDDTIEVLDEFAYFDYGWNYAMDIAGSKAMMEDNGYDRIIVDIWADWSAEYGWFTEDILQGPGFKFRAIHIPDGARVTLNMNGHTIDRGLTEDQGSGEVLNIFEGADVVINDGTITGGWSDNGAGGIHIYEDAKVVLNNVNVVGNSVTADDGAGIAVGAHATLIMNYGSISNNVLNRYVSDFFNITIHPYGALYANKATVTLNGVTVSNNRTDDPSAEGVAIYATDSTVTMNDCIVTGNALASESSRNAESVIAADDSKLTITNTDFTNNATSGVNDGNDNARLFYIEDSQLNMVGGKITGNHAHELFEFNDSDANIKDVTITDNASRVLYVDNGGEKVTMTACTLGNNEPNTDMAEIRVVNQGTLEMTKDCNVGDTTFEDKRMVIGQAAGSIFGEGSLTMIVSILALAASIASIGISFALNKKKAVPVTASNAEAETEEEA